MNLNPETREFLTFLKAHPDLRLKIRAAPGQTLLYAGSVFKPMWREIEEFKRTNLSYSTKETLPEVLARLRAPSAKHAKRLNHRCVSASCPWVFTERILEGFGARLAELRKRAASRRTSWRRSSTCRAA